MMNPKTCTVVHSMCLQIYAVTTFEAQVSLDLQVLLTRRQMEKACLGER